jgi:TatD DNase family protein
MELIDIGVNFHSSQLGGKTAELLERARAAGVIHILATGTSLHSSEQAVELAGQHPHVWATAGVHPHGARDYDRQAASQLAALWQHPRVVAVGECGLDYNRMFSPRDAQRHAFEAQLAAAGATGKPLFLHCRDAFGDFHAMLRDAAAQGARGVVHCFTGAAAEAEAYLALGFDIGITGWVTDTARGGDLRDALRAIPLERLHLETDAPYLRPKNAGKTRPYNEPALLPHIAAAVAQLMGLPVEALAKQATANSRRLFGLPGCGLPG